MGAAQVVIREIDLSTRVPSFPGVYGGIVIKARKGPTDKRSLVTSESQLLEKFTIDSRIEVGFDLAFFSAMAFLQQSNKLWVKRAVNGALYGGVVIKTAASVTANYALPAGMSDPTAYIFDSLPDVPAVAESGSFTCVPDITSFLNNKYFLINSTTVQYYVWYNVAGAGLNPGLVGKTGIQVNIPVNESAANIATATAAALNAVSGVFTASSTGAVVSYAMVVAGPVVDIADGPTPNNTTFTFPAPTVQGAAAISTVDEAILIYAADQGAWAGANQKIAIKLTNYVGNEAKVKEPGAFLIEVFKAPNLVVPVESFTCSRVSGARDGFGNNIFINDALQASSFIRGISNPAVAESVLPKAQATALFLAGGTDGVAVTDGIMIQNAQAAFTSKDETPLTIMMDGGNATPAYQQALDTMIRARFDSVSIFSVPVSAESSSAYMNDIVDYKRTQLNIDSSFAALYTPGVKIYDKFNDRSIFVSPDGYAAAAISFSASNFEIWFPPAGFRRGGVTVLDLRRRFTKGEMDVLYDNNINPLRFVPGRGIYIWGQKTLAARPSALDRLNVRLLLCVIEPAIAIALEDFLFEINDAATRALVTALISGYMENIKARRGVTDFRVVCDDSNNSPESIDAGRLVVWLFIKPTRSAEEIPFSVIITSTGVSFDLAQSLVT